MRSGIFLVAAVALAAPFAVSAQTSSPPADAPDPAGLAAATRLLDVTYPPDRREATVSAMMKAMMANMTSAMRSNPEIAAMYGDDRVEPIFNRFMAKIQADAEVRIKAGLPGMIEAMKRAYSRRFTIAQMDELTRFFATPTGRLYFEQGQTILSDPDVAAWQKGMVTDAFGKMPEQMRALMAEIMALKPPLQTK